MSIFVLALALSLFVTAQLHAQASFFEGKTIRIVVGLPAADVYDIYARLLATYMGKYIPGNPNLMVQIGKKRDPRLADVPTVNELMDEYKTPEATRKLAGLALAPGEFGRPIMATPGIPAERAKILRDAFAKTLKDPDLLAEAKKKLLEIDPTTGEELAALANELMSANRDLIARLEKLLGK
ncbi:MAG: hypothetical protein ACREPG_12215 [Candidatus Binatia bacterium]